MPEPTVPLPVGTVLGAFEITGFVASGGMGSVYQARNTLTGQVRALKVMLPSLATRAEFLTRFVREIQITASIEHPNVVRVFEPGVDRDRIFLPMELLEGETLASLLRRGPLDPRAAVDILLQVGRAVAVFHGQGVLHRDLKPSNIFMARGRDGHITPKVLDFGAARPVEISDDATATGLVIGSPHYMAFEQASGAKDLDGRVDQYALGVILYQSVTGARPFENDDTGHAMAKVLAGVPFRHPRQLVPTLPEGLERAILRALGRRREERFPTLQEFLSAIEASVQTHPAQLLAAPHGPADFDQTRYAPVGPPLASTPSSLSANTNTAQVVAGRPPPAPRESSAFGRIAVVALLVVAVGGVGFRVWRGRQEAARAAAAAAAATQSLAEAAPPAAPPVTPPPSTPSPPDPSPTSAPAAPALVAPVAPVAPVVGVVAAAASGDASSPAAPAPAASATPKKTETKRARPAPPSAAAPCVPRPGSPCM